MTPQQRQITAFLIDHYPKAVSLSRIIGHLYGLDPNGGPDAPEKNIKLQIWHIKKRIISAGWTIGGYAMGGTAIRRYRLEPMAPKDD